MSSLELLQQRTKRLKYDLSVLYTARDDPRIPLHAKTPICQETRSPAEVPA